jgi:CHASE3 domain sensor protein
VSGRAFVRQFEKASRQLESEDREALLAELEAAQEALRELADKLK